MCLRLRLHVAPIIVVGLTVAALLRGGGPVTKDKAPKRFDNRILKNVLGSSNEFKNPTLISTRKAGNNVEAILEVKFAKNKIGQDEVRTRTYNGNLVGGTIRARPGDILRVKLVNNIPASEPDISPVKNHNRPNGLNITNLHTHGLHVSPEGRSDNIFLEVRPEEQIDLCFEIPDIQKAGTCWYHAHRHGSAALQLTSGMAGPLIVDGGPGSLDAVPEIKAATEGERERILLFQQFVYSMRRDCEKSDAPCIGEVTVDDVFGQRDAADIQTLINGILAPEMKIRPGEIQRWRCIHGGIQETIKLSLKDPATPMPDDPKNWLQMHEIALDGLPLGTIRAQNTIELQPGYRSDFLVQAPLLEKDVKRRVYVLTGLPIAANRSLRRTAQPERHFARLVVEGDPVDGMSLPKENDVKKYALVPVDDGELFNRVPRQLRFRASGGTFTVNNESFDKDQLALTLQLKTAAQPNTAEEWALISDGEFHPFHIHINPFEVVKKDGAGKIVCREWHDTYFITEDNDDTNPVYVRSRFELYPGKTVLHCHNLLHEDSGMMMAVRIVGPAPLFKCPPLLPGGLLAAAARAPGWTLSDAQDKAHRLQDFVGRDVLLVFFRGVGCRHCMAQLRALAQRQDALAAARLAVVAVCPDSPAELRRAQEGERLAAPFLLLADPSGEAFRRYGCHDGRALHGTFLIDRGGAVRWQAVGDEPFMDLDRLLAESRSLLAGPPE